MNNRVKFVKCTQEQYDALEDKDDDTIYVTVPKEDSDKDVNASQNQDRIGTK